MLSLHIALSDADLGAIHEAILALPHEDRVRLVERAKAKLVEGGPTPSGGPSALIGNDGRRARGDGPGLRDGLAGSQDRRYVRLSLPLGPGVAEYSRGRNS